MSTRLQRLSRSVLIATLFIALMAGLVPTAAQDDVPWPTDGWLTSTPEEQGVDSALLADLIESMPKNGIVDSLMVVRNGYVVAEVYWHPFARGMKREMGWGSMSVLSALIGIAIDQGHIQGVEQKVLDFFPEIDVENLDDNKRAITIRDLLTMTSGFACHVLDGNDPVAELIAEPDATSFGLGWKMAEAPGTSWRYCHINVYVLSAILTRTTGMDTLTFARQYLFGPLGITDVSWNVSAEGLALGYAGLQLATQDMAKIGYMFLNGGRWGDQQVVPEAWIPESTGTQVAVSFSASLIDFGYLWWIYHSSSGEFYESTGEYFQHIHVSPEKSLVVADTGMDHSLALSNVTYPAIMMRIMDCVKSDEPLPANPEGLARLNAAIQAAANPAGEPPEALPPLAGEVSGKTYHLTTPNLLLAEADYMSFPVDDWQITTLRLDFGQDMAALTLQTQSGVDLTVPIGLDGVYRVAETYLGTLAAEGRWVSDTRFRIDLRRLEQGRMVAYTLDFTTDGLTGRAWLTRPGDSGLPWAPAYADIQGQLAP